MNVELWLFGVQVMCFTIGASDAGADEVGDSGYTTSMPVGFVARHEIPDEVAIHRPVSPFEDDSEI